MPETRNSGMHVLKSKGCIMINVLRKKIKPEDIKNMIAYIYIPVHILVLKWKSSLFLTYMYHTIFSFRFTPVPDSVLARAAASTGTANTISDRDQVCQLFFFFFSLNLFSF